MAIKGRIDGLQVLKGGQGKATVYFDKDAMHGALDLNEKDVTIEAATGAEAVHDAWKEKAMSMFDSLVEQLREECRPQRPTAQDICGLLQERKEDDGINSEAAG